MKTIQYKSKIAEAFGEVRTLSFEAKGEAAYDEKKLDGFLDAILELKSSLTKKADQTEKIVEKIEKITWFNNLDREVLMLVNDLIAVVRDLHTIQIRQLASLMRIRNRGIATAEIKVFKGAIDDLKEVANDLESRFFFLPAMEEFEETTKELSLL